MTNDREETLRAFQALFMGHALYYGRYPCSGETFKDGKPMTPWTETAVPLTDNAWLMHLTGKGMGLGIVPVMEDNTCVFGAIDHDTKHRDKDTGDMVYSEADFPALYARIQSEGLPLILCRSRHGGAHMYCFTSEPGPARLMRDRLRDWALTLGVYINPNGSPVEIFPKQGHVDAESKGSWINLPYFRAKTTDRPAYGPGVQPLDLKGFIALANSKLLSLKDLKSFKSVVVKSGLHPESPPCMQVLDRDGYPQGTRNEGLVNVGLLFEKTHPEHWEQMTRDYNAEKFQPPMTDQEVEGVIKSLRRDFAGNRKYTYGCNKPPINVACNRDLCKKMSYGIDSFEAPASSIVEALIKVDVDPPRWLAYVGGRPVDVKTEELLDPKQFTKRALETLNELIKPGTLPQWNRMIRNLLEGLKVIDAPEDAGVFGQFKAAVRRYMERRVPSDDNGWSDVLRDLPVEDKGWVYFRSESLIKFITEKCRFREYKANEVYNGIRRMGGEHYTGKLPGTRMTVNLWKLPVPTEGEEQDSPFELPQESGGDF